MEPLSIVRAAYGAALLVAPRGVLSALARDRLDDGSLAVARLLGTRQLVQAIALREWPTDRDRFAGAGVDALHCASMVALARLAGSPLHRRLAGRDARSAALFALAGTVDAARRRSS